MAKGLDALMIAAGPPKLPGGGSRDDEPGAGGAKLRAARSLRQALRGDDDSAIASAFSRMMTLCEGGGYDDESEGGDEEI